MIHINEYLEGFRARYESPFLMRNTYENYVFCRYNHESK